MSDPMRYTTRHRRLSDAEIIDLYAELRDSDVVAIRAGCSAPTVLGILRAAGVPVMPRGGRAGRRQPLALPDTEIVRLYLAGLPCIGIGERAGCSTSTVYRVLARMGVPRRGAFGL